MFNYVLRYLNGPKNVTDFWEREEVKEGEEFNGIALPIKLFDESLLIEPLEHATSSEKDTLEFLDCLLEEDEDDEDTEDLSDLTGTTTGDSEEQFSQLATLSLAIRGTLPSSLQKLSLASLL